MLARLARSRRADHVSSCLVHVCVQGGPQPQRGAGAVHLPHARAGAAGAGRGWVGWVAGARRWCGKERWGFKLVLQVRGKGEGPGGGLQGQWACGVQAPASGCCLALSDPGLGVVLQAAQGPLPRARCLRRALLLFDGAEPERAGAHWQVHHHPRLQHGAGHGPRDAPARPHHRAGEQEGLGLGTLLPWPAQRAGQGRAGRGTASSAALSYRERGRTASAAAKRVSARTGRARVATACALVVVVVVVMMVVMVVGGGRW